MAFVPPGALAPRWISEAAKKAAVLRVDPTFAEADAANVPRASVAAANGAITIEPSRTAATPTVKSPDKSLKRPVNLVPAAFVDRAFGFPRIQGVSATLTPRLST